MYWKKTSIANITATMTSIAPKAKEEYWNPIVSERYPPINGPMEENSFIVWKVRAQVKGRFGSKQDKAVTKFTHNSNVPTIIPSWPKTQSMLYRFAVPPKRSSLTNDRAWFTLFIARAKPIPWTDVETIVTAKIAFGPRAMKRPWINRPSARTFEAPMTEQRWPEATDPMISATPAQYT